MSDENQHPITASIPDTAAATSSASTQPYKVTTASAFGGDADVHATDTQYLLRNCLRLKQFARWPGVAPCCNLQGVLNCPRPEIHQRARWDPSVLLSLALSTSASIPLKSRPLKWTNEWIFQCFQTADKQHHVWLNHFPTLNFFKKTPRLKLLRTRF